MPPKGHSLFSASSAKRWIHCPASISLSERVPDDETSSSFADEGTAAHALAEKCILNKKTPWAFVGTEISVHGNSFEVNQEMCEVVTAYMMEILKYASRKHNPEVTGCVNIETRFNLDWIGRKGLFGTCDASLADSKSRTIYIWDLKYGMGVPVYAEENCQLMYYALGVLGLRGVENFDKAILTIVQPRCRKSGISSWEITKENLIKWKDEVLVPAIDEALADNPHFSPSQDSCRWCRGKVICPALLGEISSVVAKKPVESESVSFEFPKVDTLSDEQIEKVLTFLPLLKSYCDEVAAYTLHRAIEGDCIKGFKLVRGRQGNRQWVDESVVENAFKKYGDAIYAPKKLLSPSKMEKALGEGEKNAIKSFVYRPEGSLSLVPLSDKREAVTVEKNKALEQFFGEEIGSNELS